MSATKATIAEAVERALGTTLETMAFEQAIPVDGPLECEEEMYWANLPILEPYYGGVSFITCKTGANMLVELVHGPPEDEGLPPEILFDTFAELINTLGGRFMSELVPDDVSFKLGLPQTGRSDAQAQGDVAYSGVFQIDEYKLVVTVTGAGFKSLVNETK